MNNLGQVVGFSGTGPPGEREPGQWVHAFVWAPDTGMIDLGVLTGPGNSEAHAINDAGQVVGWAGRSGAESGQLAVWSPTSDR